MVRQKSPKQLGGIWESDFGFLWGIYFAWQFSGLSPAALAPQKAPQKRTERGDLLFGIVRFEEAG